MCVQDMMNEKVKRCLPEQTRSMYMNKSKSKSLSALRKQASMKVV